MAFENKSRNHNSSRAERKVNGTIADCVGKETGLLLILGHINQDEESCWVDTETHF
jgi:hypothetical protein